MNIAEYKILKVISLVESSNHRRLFLFHKCCKLNMEIKGWIDKEHKILGRSTQGTFVEILQYYLIGMLVIVELIMTLDFSSLCRSIKVTESSCEITNWYAQMLSALIVQTKNTIRDRNMLLDNTTAIWSNVSMPP